MRARRLAATGGALLAAAGVCAADPSTEDVRARARALLADGGYQTALPGGETAAGGAGGGEVQGRGRDGGRRRTEASGDSRPPPRRRLEIPLLPGGEVLAAFAWVVLAVVLALGIGRLVTELWWGRGRRATTPASPPERAPPAAERARAGLDQVEALAGSGRYADAVHLLLQVVLERLARRRPIAASMTSREILAGAGGAPFREPLATLIETVERSWFGGAEVGPDAYERCLAAGRRLTSGAAGGDG